MIRLGATRVSVPAAFESRTGNMRRSSLTVVAMWVAGTVMGCDAADGADGDADVDADSDADTDGDAGGDADSDVDADIEGDADGDGDVDRDDAAAEADVDPDRRYGDIEHLSDGELIDALLVLVDGHVSLGYTEARRVMFNEIDGHDGLIEGVYTGLTVAADGSYTPGSFNTEHTWPQSEGADSEPAQSDLHHLFPTDNDANSRRGSYPYGETACTGAACTWAVGGSELGEVEGGTAIVFQVRPEARGDIARAHFYFSVRYGLPIPDSEEVFLRPWNDEDPPSPEEVDRNDAIEIYQLNRNPFVDRPDFVAQIADF
jgi:endonuclease I